jgi:hypothetical protein
MLTRAQGKLASLGGAEDAFGGRFFVVPARWRRAPATAVGKAGDGFPSWERFGGAPG